MSRRGPIPRYRRPIGPAGKLVTSPPSGAVVVGTTDNLATVVSGAANGAVFWFTAGVYREQSCTPKTNQRFYGASGAILNGSKILTGWVVSGATWYVTGQTQAGEDRTELAPFCRPGFRCTKPDAVFIDNVQQQHVATLAEVGAGKFFFDYAAGRIYIGTDPTGKTVEAAVTPYAFLHGATGVHIEGLTVEKYATPLQHAAIGQNGDPDGWTVQHCEIRLNNALGIRSGPNCRILYNFVHDNGEMGLGGANGNINSLIEGNETSFNGEMSGLDPLYEGGGTKWALTTGLVVRGNYTHDNFGYGLWTDIDNIDTLYENNRVISNKYGGIVHEISYAATIRYNTSEFNGILHNGWLWGGGIQLQNSRDVLVYHNTVDCTGTANGITVIHQNRDVNSGPTGPYSGFNNTITYNTVIAGTFDKGQWGVASDFDDAAALAGGNVFDFNTYKVFDINNDHWMWVDQDFLTLAGVRSYASQELNSTISAI